MGTFRTQRGRCTARASQWSQCKERKAADTHRGDGRRHGVVLGDEHHQHPELRPNQTSNLIQRLLVVDVAQLGLDSNRMLVPCPPDQATILQSET